MPLKGHKPSEAQLRFLYWNKKLGLSQIGKIYKRKKSTIRRWMVAFNIQRRSASEAVKLCAYKLEPDINPSEDLAYILGVLYGDGNVTKWKNQCDIRLIVKDELFAKSFAHALTAIGLNPSIWKKRKRKDCFGKWYEDDWWFVKATSKVFYCWFQKQTTTHLERLLDNPKYATSFLRGLYESEGSCGYWRDKRSKTGRYWTLRIRMRNKEILKLSQKLFQKIGFRVCFSKAAKHSYYGLTKTGNDVLKILSILKPCIKGVSNCQP